MNITSLITCVGENSRKFLELTLLFNKKHFDNIYIVTDSKDTQTQEVCEIANVNCLSTDLFYKNNAKFNRGAIINYAISQLKNPEWIFHLDADILLKDEFEFFKKTYNGPNDLFFGMRRVIIPSRSDFTDIMMGKVSEGKFTCYPGCGWGYAQLWNNNCDIAKNNQYPESYDSSIGDWQWRNLWGQTIENDTRFTGKLRELSMTCLHLGEPNIEKNQSFWN